MMKPIQEKNDIVGIQAMSESFADLEANFQAGHRSSVPRQGIRVIIKLPWTIISKLPGFAILKHLLCFIFSQNNEETKSDRGNNEASRKPLFEFSKSGVHFAPTNGNISNIAFDVKSVTC
uniref:Uncharacterized protein n=1 Tax=Rhizophora mucronata TaxID=61149 RepID=A0A2P2PJY9_RHIMU